MQNIVVRQLDGGPDATTAKYWFDEDPFMSHFFNAVSSTFPEGERFFIRAVRHYAEQVTADGELPLDQETVRRFVAQEGRHSIEHDDHMQILRDQGFTGIDTFNRNQKSIMGWLNRRAPRASLALTVAIEHVTAVLAHEFLSRPEKWLGPMDPSMQVLWRWHAVEETEHKSVAHDVYTAHQLPKWLLRVAMLDATIGFLGEIFVRHSYLLIKDRQFTPRALWHGFGRLFGRDGYLRCLLSELNKFYRADFHPNQQDDTRLLQTRCQEWGLATA